VTSIRLSEFALKKRAESVAVSVAVVGHRLIEAIRGSAGWDEDVWRSLRVLVDVIGLSAGGGASVSVGLADSGTGARRGDEEGGWQGRGQQARSRGLWDRDSNNEAIGSDDADDNWPVRTQGEPKKEWTSARQCSNWV